MFLSLVRPDRISSPMTRTAAVTAAETAAVTSGSREAVMMILDPGVLHGPFCPRLRPACHRAHHVRYHGALARYKPHANRSARPLSIPPPKCRGLARKAAGPPPKEASP